MQAAAKRFQYRLSASSVARYYYVFIMVLNVIIIYVMLFHIKRNCCRRRLPAGPKGPLATCGGTAILT